MTSAPLTDASEAVLSVFMPANSARCGIDASTRGLDSGPGRVSRWATRCAAAGRTAAYLARLRGGHPACVEDRLTDRGADDEIGGLDGLSPPPRTPNSTVRASERWR